MGWGGARAVVVALVVVVAGCALFEPKKKTPVQEPGLYVAAAPAPSPSPAFAWTRGAEVSLVVRKAEHTLTVYRNGKQEKVYPVVLGIAAAGPKVYQGDLRTPEGVYYITGKRVHDKWSRFMLLSYPNPNDRQRYAMAMTEGRVPIVDGAAPGLGGEVGIHGTDREDSNIRGIDWTLGCVSLLNEHVDELYEIAPVGTPVLIQN